MLTLPGSPHHGGTLTGHFRRHRLQSEKLGERNVTVMLPPNYDPNSDKEYPILYLQDGQNMFDRREGFMGREWGADEIALEAMQAGRMREAILVAVDHGGANRLAEYSPVADSQHGGGRADDYLDFLTQEVDPMVRSSYKTTDEKAAVLGSSMGGLISLYAGFRHPDMFGAVGALSPSLWWADGHLAREVLQSGATAPDRVWLDIGDQEGGTDTIGKGTIEGGLLGDAPAGANGVQDVRDRVREMGEALIYKGHRPDTMAYHEVPGAGHNEAAWSRRLHDVFAWLLPT